MDYFSLYAHLAGTRCPVIGGSEVALTLPRLMLDTDIDSPAQPIAGEITALIKSMLTA